jgi:malonate transporter and related proteins
MTPTLRQTGAMTGVLIGFAIIGAVIATGYVIGRIGLLGDQPQYVLSRLVFFVLTPCLLFSVLAKADVHVLFSSLLPVSAIAAVASMVIFAVVARLVWKRAVPETVVGSLASGYVNANNIGIPVSVYVLGNGAFSAPIVLLQLIVFAPIALTILDTSTHGAVSLRRILMQPVRNPLIIASMLGLVVAVSGIEIPVPVMEPFRLIGGAAVPLVLLGFGMSLSGARILEPGTSRRDVVLAMGLKVLFMPIAAWAVAHLVFGLEGRPLFVAVALAALPTAQNVFNYAQRYDRGVVTARDTVLITTLLSVPALLVISIALA